MKWPCYGAYARQIGLKNPVLRGGSFVAVALHATADLASNRFPAGSRLSFDTTGFAI